MIDIHLSIRLVIVLIAGFRTILSDREAIMSWKFSTQCGPVMMNCTAKINNSVVYGRDAFVCRKVTSSDKI